MYDNILSPQTKEVLLELTPKVLPEDSYLGGGTAVALHLGHRKSEDLGFFTKSEFVEKQWEQKLKKEMGFSLIKRDWQTLIGEVKGVKFSLLGYSYGLIRPLADFENVKIASAEDLSAMKLDTLVGRGAKRDLVDVYFLAAKFGINKLLDFYQEKYGNFEEKEIMLKKSLIYFEEADKKETPEMLKDVSWKEVKTWFIEHVSL